MKIISQALSRAHSYSVNQTYRVAVRVVSLCYERNTEETEDTRAEREREMGRR